MGQDRLSGSGTSGSASSLPSSAGKSDANAAAERSRGSKSSSRAKFSSKSRTLSSGATRLLTNQITQQEIMRQVVRDEHLSGDSFSRLYTESQTLAGGPGMPRAPTGEELVANLTQPGKSHAELKRTVHVLSKDLRRTGVSRRHLLRAVMEDERQFKTCLGMPMTLLFSFLFIAYFQIKYSTSTIYLGEAALRTEIGDLPFDATTHSDVIDWLQGSMLPWLWTLPNVDGSSDDSSDSAAKHQTLMAGVLLKTARSEITSPCKEVIKPWGSTAEDCVFGESNAAPAGSDTTLNAWAEAGRRLSSLSPNSNLIASMLGQGSWFRPYPRANKDLKADKQAKVSSEKRRRLEESPAEVDRKLSRFYKTRNGLPRPRRRLVGQATRSHSQHEARQRQLKEILFGYLDQPVSMDDPIYIKAIPMSMPLDEAQAMIVEMGTSGLLTHASTLFSVQFFVRSKGVTPNMMTDCTINFMFSRGGGLYTEVSLQTVVLDLSGTAGFVLFLFSLALLRITFLSIGTAVVSARRGAFKQTFLRYSHIIDVLIAIGGWLILAMVLWETTGAIDLDDKFKAYEADRESIAAAELQAFDSSWLEAIEADISVVRWVANNLMSVVAQYNFLLLLRFLGSTIGHPRLAVLTRTLVYGAQDLLHLLLVLLLVFLAFVLSGHILMGIRMEELATFKGAWGYCLQIIYQRQYDFDRMVEENMFANAVWIVAFVIVLVLVMVNLLLAMVFDSYAVVRDAVGQDVTIWQFCKRLVVQLRIQSQWISNTDLLVKLSNLPLGQTPTITSVRRQFPEISDPQLELLFQHAVDKHSQGSGVSSKNSFAEYMAGLLLAVSATRRGVRKMAISSSKKKDKERKSRNSKAGKEGGDTDDGPAANAGSARDSEEEEEPEEPGSPVSEPAGANAAALLPSSVVAPAKQPAWAESGLQRGLQEQQEMLRRTLDAMEGLKATMKELGLPAISPEQVPPPRGVAKEGDPWHEAQWMLETQPSIDCTKQKR